MNPLPQQTLAMLITQYGRNLIDDPPRCEALLRDLCGMHKPEIAALIGALKDGVPVDLQKTPGGASLDLRLATLAGRVESNLGLNSALARWAVESWAIALGLLADRPTGAPVGTLPPSIGANPSHTPPTISPGTTPPSPRPIGPASIPNRSGSPPFWTAPLPIAPAPRAAKQPRSYAPPAGPPTPIASPPAPVAKGQPRHRSWGCAVLVGLLLIGSIFTVSSLRPPSSLLTNPDPQAFSASTSTPMAAYATNTAVIIIPTDTPSTISHADTSTVAGAQPTGWLAFASNRGGHTQSQIYIIGPDGSHERRLTNTSAYNLYPDWSPDGTQIVYISSIQRDSASPGGDLYIMDADGGNAHPITHSRNAKWPRWSPDGQWIIFADAQQNKADLYDLYAIRPDGTDLWQLMDTPGFDGFPTWTRNGRIIFSSTRQDQQHDHLYVINANAQGLGQLTFAPGEQENASVSPDGSQLAMVATNDGGDHIYTMKFDGSDMTQITFDPGIDRYPCWSPDGRWIAFHSKRNDNWDLYVVPRQGGEPRRVTTSPDADDEPAWSP